MPCLPLVLLLVGISDADEDTNHNGVVDPGESDPHDHDTDRDNVPDEVERHMGAPLPGWGLELEVPMTDRVEAIDGRSDQLALPQVHLNVDTLVKVQLGFGVLDEAEVVRPLTALRVCWEN